jgi:4,5-DOPA dioxygenase extradiol
VTSIFDPAESAGAFDALVHDAARASAAQRAWGPDDGPLPALYISHGAPPLFDDAPWIRELFSWAQNMPKPRSILIVSAHWESAPMTLSASSSAPAS